MDKNEFQKNMLKLKEMWHRFDYLFNLYAKSVGLNFTTISILELLYSTDEVYTQKELCEKLGLPKQLVNSIIKSFWEQSYVELKEAKDRRNKEILLTDKGTEYANKVLSTLQDIDYKAWECFTKEEMQVFLDAMEKYEKSFERSLKNLINSEDSLC